MLKRLMFHRKIFTTAWRSFAYGSTSNFVTSKNMVVIDLRSDTVTKPTQAMRKAMANADVGDDVHKEDPTVNELEKRCAQLFGMEAALFVPSGTMGNLISIMAHCDIRGSELIVGSNSHIQLYEQGGYAQLAGVACWPITPEKDGTLDLSLIDAAIHLDDDPHLTKTQLLCLENTNMRCGGRILPLDYHKKARELTKERDVKIHLDGARLMNACVGLNVQPKEILQYVDSVSMCFSKGLGCPVGSIISGSNDFIKKAIRFRKLLGGGMRQVGILAAAALHVLDSPYEEMIRRDHKNAKHLAEGIANLKCKNLTVDPKTVETNIIMINTGEIPAQWIIDLLEKADKSGVSVKIESMAEKILRIVTHRDISDQDVDIVLEKFNEIVAELY